MDELEAAGVLVRVRDPADRRAKLIRFSEAAGQTLLDGMASLRETEVELGQAIGDEHAEQLYAALIALHDTLIAEGTSDP